MASNIVGYVTLIAITTIISVGLYMITDNYLNNAEDIIQNKNLEEIAFKLHFYLEQAKYLEDNTTIGYSFYAPYICVSPLKKGILIERKNKIGSFVYYKNASSFDCKSEVVFDKFGNKLAKISDGVYRGTGNNEIFFVCDPKVNISTQSSTRCANSFDILYKKLNSTNVEVEV